MAPHPARDGPRSIVVYGSFCAACPALSAIGASTGRWERNVALARMSRTERDHRGRWLERLEVVTRWRVDCSGAQACVHLAEGGQARAQAAGWIRALPTSEVAP